jgi:putative inorganic carbon (HCO3(-)) transporter
MLPIIGVQFLRSGWLGKLLCLVSGVFTANALVLTRSRGAFLGVLASGVAAAILAPRKHRPVIWAAIVVAAIGGLYLADEAFWSRAGTITASAEERDASASSRLEIWEAAVRMTKDHPFGIGAGNFFQTISRYNPLHVGRDTHNTYLRCAAEVGVPGIALLLLLIFNAFRCLWRLFRDVRELPGGQSGQTLYVAYGLLVSLVACLVGCITMTLLYVEFLWWLLALPVCLERAVANLKSDLAIALVPPPPKSTRGAKVLPIKPWGHSSGRA